MRTPPVNYSLPIAVIAGQPSVIVAGTVDVLCPFDAHSGAHSDIIVRGSGFYHQSDLYYFDRGYFQHHSTFILLKLQGRQSLSDQDCSNLVFQVQ